MGKELGVHLSGEWGMDCFAADKGKGQDYSCPYWFLFSSNSELSSWQTAYSGWQILTSFSILLLTLVTSLVSFANLCGNRLPHRTVCSLAYYPSSVHSTFHTPCALVFIGPCIMRGLNDFYPRNDFSYFVENRHCHGCSRTEIIHFIYTSKWPMAYIFNKIFNKLWAQLYVRIQPTQSFGRVFSSFLKRRNKMRFQGMWIRQQKDWEDIAQPPRLHGLSPEASKVPPIVCGISGSFFQSLVLVELQCHRNHVPVHARSQHFG